MIVLTELFVFALIMMGIYSIIDLKTKKLDNIYILVFLFLGVMHSIFINKNIAVVGLGIALMSIVTITLWYFKTIGGADAKLLIALVPYMSFFGIPNMLVVLWFFLIELAVLGFIYGFLYIKFFKFKGKIPFIPIITLTYVVSWVFRIT